MGKTEIPRNVEGSQSISRAVDLLSFVAAHRELGVRLGETATATGLNIATTRRILQALVSQGLLAFDIKTKLYIIGPAIFSFAAQANPWLARRELFLPALDNIARRTSDTTLFSMRSGMEAICLERREGTYPIRVMSLETGSRRPLGAGSGSLAILAFLPELERTDIIRKCAVQYEPYKLSIAILKKSIAKTRENGFSFNPGLIIDGVYGVGVPILSSGSPVASISVAAIASRMSPARRGQIVDIICEELASIPEILVPSVLNRQPTPPEKKVTSELLISK